MKTPGDVASEGVRVRSRSSRLSAGNCSMGLEGWLREGSIRHRGNADVVRQDLLTEKA
jgi:hypothetical protein